MSDLVIGGMRFEPVGGEPTALSAPPDEVMRRARAAVGATQPGEMVVGGMRFVPVDAVPKLGLDEEERSSLLGDAESQQPPHHWVGTAPSNQTIVPKGVQPPTDLTQDAEVLLNEKLQRIQQARGQEEERGILNNMFVSARKRIGNAILGAPAALADVMPGQAAQRAAFALTGQPQPQGFPQLTVDEVGSRLAALAPGVTLDQARENLDIAEGAREYVHPESTVGGNVVGDIGTIVGGKLPFNKGLVEATKSPQTMDAIRRAVEMGPTGPLRHMKRVWNSEVYSSVRRALGKAGETGMEAGLLSWLHGDDPLKTGAAAAAGQTLGSFALGTIKHPLHSMGAIAASALLWQMFKEVVPGGKDFILESAEHATQLGAYGTVAGLLSTAMGAGRFRGSGGLFPAHKYSPSKPPIYGHGFARDLPQIAEGANAALRTGPNSLITQFMDDEKTGSPILGKVMDKLATNANEFTQHEIARLTRAITKGNLRLEVKRMLNNEDFAARMGF